MSALVSATSDRREVLVTGSSVSGCPAEPMSAHFEKIVVLEVLVLGWTPVVGFISVLVLASIVVVGFVSALVVAGFILIALTARMKAAESFTRSTRLSASRG